MKLISGNSMKTDASHPDAADPNNHIRDLNLTSRKIQGANFDAFVFQTRRNEVTKEVLNRLVQTAIRLGASDAEIIPSADIVIEDDLANLCNGEPRCENYSLAPSCPPHVPGPSGFRKWQKKSEHSVVVRFDVPTAVMFSHERRDVMQQLHEIVAGVEQEAARMGCDGSKAFAGGSCKKLFCPDHAACRVLSEQAECRNPRVARPSMSGFGINVVKMMQSAGWPNQQASYENASDKESMTWVAGLIVLADD